MNRKFIVLLTVSVAVLISCCLPLPRAVFSHQDESAIVVIDAGHGGIDGGAVGKSGIEEKQLNLEIAKKLRTMLGFIGFDNKMTRENDMYVTEDGKTIREKKISDTKARVELINNTPNAYLISVHLNHFSQGECSGAQVFYTSDKSSKVIAEHLQENLRLGIDKNNRRVAKEIGSNIYIMNNINCPGVLVECGFLSNACEEQLLQNEDYQRKIALSAAIGFADGYREVKNYEN